MKYVISLLCLVVINCASVKDNKVVSIHDEKKEMLEEFLAGGERPDEIVNISIPEYCTFDGIQCYGVYHGLNKDPVPPPSKYAVTVDKKIYSGWEMGELIMGADLPLETEEDALRICLLNVFLSEHNAAVIKGPETLYTDEKNGFCTKSYIESIPEKTRKSIEKPQVEKMNDTWNVILSVYIRNTGRVIFENEIRKRSFVLSRDSFKEDVSTKEIEELE